MKPRDEASSRETVAHEKCEPAVVGARVVSPPGPRVTETVLELSRAAKRGLTIRGSIPPVPRHPSR
jgi:hypothetical protein